MGTEGTYFNITKVIYDKHTANLILNGHKLKEFPLWSGTRQRCLLWPLSLIIVLEVLATAIREEEEIKGIQIGKEEVKLSLFADDMILYINNPKYSTKKANDKLIKKCVGYKINTEKSIAFLCTNNELSERETKKKSHLLLHQKEIKYLGINLTKHKIDL